jgi:hypothetical protein
MVNVVSHMTSVEEQIFINKCVGIASIALLYYDYLLTLPLEVSRFWDSRRLTWASSFFYLNRYLSLLGHAPVAFQYMWTNPNPNRLQECIRLSNFHQYLAVAIQIIVGILLIMRTYALYNCRKAVLLLLCIAGLIVIAFGIWCVMSGQGTTPTPDELPLSGCLLPVSDNVAKRLAAAWTGMLCFDIMIFSMTLYKSLTYKRGGSTTILFVMLRDGTIYFGLMVAACVSVILSFRLSPSYEKGVTTILTNVISSTMISRLMLNIRNPKLNSNYRTDLSGTTTGPSHPMFTTIIDTSIGGHSGWRTRDETFSPSAEDPRVDIELASRTKSPEILI